MARHRDNLDDVALPNVERGNARAVRWAALGVAAVLAACSTFGADSGGAPTDPAVEAGTPDTPRADIASVIERPMQTVTALTVDSTGIYWL